MTPIARKRQTSVGTVELPLDLSLLKFDFDEPSDQQTNQEGPKTRGIREMIIHWLNQEL